MPFCALQAAVALATASLSSLEALYDLQVDGGGLTSTWPGIFTGLATGGIAHHCRPTGNVCSCMTVGVACLCSQRIQSCLGTLKQAPEAAARVRLN